VLSRLGAGTLRQALPPVAQGGLLAALFFAGAIALAGMPPLSGFIGKLLILQAAHDHIATVWPVILATSLLMILGFAAAGSTLFWKAPASPRPVGPKPPAPAALPFAAVFGLLACLVGLTVFAGPVMRSLNATSAGLYGPAPYIAANTLPAQD
jgi:multicomponent K+:H+ antiporter subunit D